jgi:predicted MFS family arabinose efflux permease
VTPGAAEPTSTGMTGSSHLYSPARRWFFLAVLFLVGTSSSVDRVVISVLLEPIKQEFGVSDTQLGLLSGLSFALLYSVLGLPIARLADRGDRRLLITIAISVWSAMTMLCAAAGSFWHLLIARVGVGVGEAGATPPAQSLIVDYFPVSSRARAIGTFATSGTAGYLIGLSIGSQVVTAYGWRATLVAFGLPGLLIAAIVYFALDEPRRSAAASAPRASTEAFGESIRRLAAKRSFVRLLIGFTFYNFAAYGSLVFVPSYLIRVVGSPIADAGLYYGLSSGLAVLIGSLAGGILCDMLVRRDKRWIAWFPALGFALAAVPNTLMFLIDDLGWFLAISTLGGILLYASLPAAFAAVHAVCGSARRATAIALLLFFGNLLGFGLGPVVTGALSDMFSASVGPTGLRYALLLVMALTVPTAIMMFSAAGAVRGDLED